MAISWIIQSALLVVGSAIVFIGIFIYYQHWKAKKRKPDTEQSSTSIEEDPTRKDEARLQMRLNSIQSDMDQMGVNYIKDTFVEGIPVEFHLPDQELVILTDPKKAPQFSNHKTRVVEGPEISNDTGPFVHALYDPETVLTSTVSKDDLADTDLSEAEKKAFAEFNINESELSHKAQDEIQSEIRRQMKSIHPDNVSDSDEWSVEKFQQKKDAYDTLKTRYFN